MCMLWGSMLWAQIAASLLELPFAQHTAVRAAGAGAAALVQACYCAVCTLLFNHQPQQQSTIVPRGGLAHSRTSNEASSKSDNFILQQGFQSTENPATLQDIHGEVRMHVRMCVIGMFTPLHHHEHLHVLVFERVRPSIIPTQVTGLQSGQGHTPTWPPYAARNRASMLMTIYIHCLSLPLSLSWLRLRRGLAPPQSTRDPH